MQDFRSVHPFQRAPHATLVRLALPVLVSLAAEPVTGAVDTAFVARLGASSLAALGVGATVFSGVFWIFNFLGVGTQTEVAQRLGRQAPGKRPPLTPWPWCWPSSWVWASWWRVMP